MSDNNKIDCIGKIKPATCLNRTVEKICRQQRLQLCLWRRRSCTCWKTTLDKVKRRSDSKWLQRLSPVVGTIGLSHLITSLAASGSFHICKVQTAALQSWLFQSKNSCQVAKCHQYRRMKIVCDNRDVAKDRGIDSQVKNVSECLIKCSARKSFFKMNTFCTEEE